MNQTRNPSVRPLSSSSGATRTRAYRKRLRQRIQMVPVAVHVSDIEVLVRKGILTQANRHDPEALQAALTRVWYKFVEDD